MAYLLDTNVISELRKTQPHPSVERWHSSVAKADIFISYFSIGEVRRGIESLQRRDPVQAGYLDQWLSGLRVAYKERITGLTLEIAETWGRMDAIRPLPAVDAYLAATAKVHGWTLVTRNAKDFEGTGVSVLNPFEWPMG